LADRDAVRRIVTILVDNAVRYTDGRVEVSLDGGGAGSPVTIEVRDHGPGLGEGELFAPFVRGAAARDVPGSGLGLATAADLARRLGGDLVGSDAPGGGARLRLELPSAD
ncbi:MAG: sensor histidine kinase, partial [Nitriliruptor sp.]